MWRTVKEGSRSYVAALEARLGTEGVTLKRGVAVTRIERETEGARVTHSEGDEQFDALVIATHPDTALTIVADPSEDERRILGMFTYTRNDVVLHSDPSFMPRRKNAWASWNYHGAPAKEHVISLTYWMNSLQHIPGECPVFVTLNPQRTIDESRIHGRYAYAHPVFDRDARVAQESMSGIQGMRHTFYAGAYLGFGFHEDGALSAVRAVQALGFPIRLSV
jgi:predicted NAD/FAD-binding protein